MYSPCNLHIYIYNYIYIYNLHVETWPDISRCLQYLLPKAMDIVYALKRQGRTIYGFGSWGADGRQRLAPAGTHCYLAQGQPHCTYSIKNWFKRQKNIPQHKDGIWLISSTKMWLQATKFMWLEPTNSNGVSDHAGIFTIDLEQRKPGRTHEI